VPVSGVSMRPTLQAGDLVFLKGVSPATLRVGDVIAVNVPSVDQKQYGLPSRIVHRIEHIKHDQLGLLFITKGDANAGADVFTTRSNNVIGKLQFQITGLGYPFLFFRSRQGLIFLGATALLFALYFIMGMFEDRRITVSGNAISLEMLLSETRELKETLGMARETHTVRLIEPPPPDFVHEVDELKYVVRTSRESDAQTSQQIHELIGAVSEYGEHLQSHTAVMQNLASATFDLQRATATMSENLSRSETEERGLAPHQLLASSLALAPASSAPEFFEPASIPSARFLLGENLVAQHVLARQREALAQRTLRVDELVRAVQSRSAQWRQGFIGSS
jgi:signal peptidase I